jgi:hypothetical protein
MPKGGSASLTALRASGLSFRAEHADDQLAEGVDHQRAGA